MLVPAEAKVTGGLELELCLGGQMLSDVGAQNLTLVLSKSHLSAPFCLVVVVVGELKKKHNKCSLCNNSELT